MAGIVTLGGRSPAPFSGEEEKAQRARPTGLALNLVTGLVMVKAHQQARLRQSTGQHRFYKRRL